MTLEEHAHAIEAAIQAAYDEGFELDDGYGAAIREMDLNAVEDGQLMRYVAINLPHPTFD